MKSIIAVSVQRNRGLFAALTFAVFAATMIFVGSFAAVNADDGTEETYAVDSYGVDTDSSDGKGLPNLKLVFKSDDPTKGSVLFSEQLVPKPRGHAFAEIAVITIGNFSMVLTIEKIASFIGVFPMCIKINPVIPSDGYEVDHLSVNKRHGTVLHFLVTGEKDESRTVNIYFKEKGTEIVP